MTQTKHRRSRIKPCDRFKRVQALIHPQNFADLQSEAKRYGQSMSEVINDAATIFCRMHRGEHPLGGEPSLPPRKKGR